MHIPWRTPSMTMSNCPPSRHREDVRCCQDRNAALAAAPVVRGQPQPSAANRSETEGFQDGLSVSRRLPRVRIVARRRLEVCSIAAAVGTAEPQAGQRHVALALVDQGLQVGLRLVLAAALAPNQDADIAASKRAAGGLPVPPARAVRPSP